MEPRARQLLERSEPQTPPAPRQPPKTTPKPRRGVAWLLLLAVAAAAYAGFRYYRTAQGKKQAAAAALAARAAARAVPVAAVPARAGDMPVYLRGLGNVTAFNSVTVRTRVDGQLMSVDFQEGQHVNKGDLLAEIDPRPFQVQLEQAEGQLARDQAQLHDAQVNLARYQTLWQEGVIPKQQLDTQAATVGQFEGAIKADQGAVDSAKLNLTYAKITAPISGRIGLRLVDAGNVVHSTDQNGLAIIDQMQPISVIFTIPADSLPPVLSKLRAGQHPRVDAYDREDRVKIASGSLLTVDNQIDPTTGTSRLKAIFDNADGALFPNQFVNCRLLIDVKHGAVIVPAAAIQHGPQGAYVYVIKPDRAADLRPVAVGITEGSETSIEKGVRAGELVVTDGQDKLQAGTKVEIRTAANSDAEVGRASP